VFPAVPSSGAERERSRLQAVPHICASMSGADRPALLTIRLRQVRKLKVSDRQLGVPGPWRPARFNSRCCWTTSFWPSGIEDSGEHIGILALETVALLQKHPILPMDVGMGPKYVPAEISTFSTLVGLPSHVASDFPLVGIERAPRRRVSCPSRRMCRTLRPDNCSIF